MSYPWLESQDRDLLAIVAEINAGARAPLTPRQIGTLFDPPFGKSAVVGKMKRLRIKLEVFVSENAWPVENRERLAGIVADIKSGRVRYMTNEQIGAQFDPPISKNAVIGKMHRMGLHLTDRLRPERVGKPRSTKAERKIETVARLWHERKASPPKPQRYRAEDGVVVIRRQARTPAGSVEVHEVEPRKDVFLAREEVKPAVTFWPKRSEPCCWPLGEVGTKQFHYCDEPSVPGRPYCPEHHAIAATPKRARHHATQEAA